MPVWEVVVVCGYGCRMHPLYRRYLERVARYSKENLVDLVVVCGGFTQKRTSPAMSEAMTMKAFLQPMIAYKTITEENNSLTTRENLANAKKIVDAHGGPRSYSIVIFCDAICALKVKILAEKVFKDYDIRLETFDMSPKGASRKQLLASFWEIIAFYLPALSWLRRKIKELRANFC